MNHLKFELAGDLPTLKIGDRMSPSTRPSNPKEMFMNEFNWIAVDVASQNVVLKIKGPRAELLRRLLDEFPDGHYSVMRVEAVATFEVAVTRVARPVK